MSHYPIPERKAGDIPAASRARVDVHADGPVASVRQSRRPSVDVFRPPAPLLESALDLERLDEERLQRGHGGEDVVRRRRRIGAVEDNLVHDARRVRHHQPAAERAYRLGHRYARRRVRPRLGEVHAGERLERFDRPAVRVRDWQTRGKGYGCYVLHAVKYSKTAPFRVVEIFYKFPIDGVVSPVV